MLNPLADHEIIVYDEQRERVNGLCDRYKHRIRRLDECLFKDECVFTFDSVETDPFGIFVCLFTFDAVGELMLDSYVQQHGPSVFLNIRKTRVLVESDVENEPTKLGLGVEGGFQESGAKVEFESRISLYFHPDRVFVRLDNPDDLARLPGFIREVIEEVSLKPSYLDDQSNLGGEKFVLDDVRPVSGCAESLIQLGFEGTIPSSGWKCEKCEITDNLWLNLTDGSILCGRKNFDGSGGNNHALDHYKQTLYPLAVKLGTITDSTADVYSYSEDAMVADPLLEKHLAHFGIKPASLTKVAKSMNELEIEVNNRAVIGANESVGSLSGPGRTGMHNMGATCYLNAVLQVLFGIIEPLKHRFFVERTVIPTGKRPGLDFGAQMAKLAHGLLSGRYNSITPKMLRSLIGKSNPAFASPGQQDACEFLLFILNEIYKYHYANDESPTESIRLSIEERDQYEENGKFQYKLRDEFILSLPMNDSDSSLLQLLERYAQEETIGTSIKRRMRIARFPKYLFIVTQRFRLSEDWTPIKLQNELGQLDYLDLEQLRAKGPQPGEEILNQNNDDQAQQLTQSEINLITTLKPLGFSHNACLKAIRAGNVDESRAIDWLLEHGSDPNLNLPDELEAKDSAVSDEHLSALVDMGFSLELARYSLLQTSNNLERAIDWLFSHPEERDKCEAGEPRKPREQIGCGSSKYELAALIVHLGLSTSCGHYVAYVKQTNSQGKPIWIGFNDEKVFECDGEPVAKGTAYIYAYIQQDD